MSHTYFNTLWAEAQKELRGMLKEEKKNASISGDRTKLMQVLTELYYKYVSIYKKMDTVDDQLVHPQKLPLIRRVFDMVIARLLEIRFVMVKSELSEYFYQDEFAHWLHWIPDELDIKIPKYYEHGRGKEWLEHQVWLEGEHVRKEAEDKERELEEALKAEEAAATAERKADMAEEIDFTVEEGIIMIQTAERGRQARAKYAMAKYFVDEEEAQRRRKKLQKLHAEGKGMDPNAAATIIQRTIRRFLAKRRVQRIREEELEFLGMSWGPHKANSPLKQALDAAKKHEKVIERLAEKRRRMQRRHVENFLEAEITIEARLRSLEAPEMAERMKWQIRTWALDVKEKTGKFPEIPKADHGGSKFIFCPDKLPEEVLQKAMEALNGKGKKKKKGKGKDKKKKKKPKKGKDKKKKKSGETVELLPPKNLDDMIKDNTEYNKMWRRRDETHNPEQRHEDQLIIHEKRELVGAEVRAQVDNMMRAELKLLKAAVEKKKGKKKGKGKGKGKKGKKGKGKGKVKGKGKKGKKGKKKKKKGKDLTKDRSLPSLFEELVKNGIIRKYPKIRLRDLQGEPSIINGTIRKIYETGMMPPMPGEDLNVRFPGDPNPPPTFGDIKRAVKDICILPVGSPTVHMIAPFTKSVLLAGPEGSGKHSLVYAVCTEMGATLMDLTAKNIAGKYPGKGKNGLKMLIHLVGKVGRLCPPTVILVDNCEKMFQKKIPKEEKKTEPKRLKKSLKKFLKTVDEEDPIILIGLTKEPWKASAKPLKKLYERMIYIPKPEYGARLNWWRTLLQDYWENLDPDINYSLLAKLSDFWTLGAIYKAFKKVLKKFKLEAPKDKKALEAPPAPPPATTDKKEQPEIGAGDAKGNTIPPPPPPPPEEPAKKEIKKMIKIDDIIKELSLQDPVFEEQDKTWTKWFNKTPLQKARMASQMNLTGKKKGKGKGKGKDKGKKGKRR